MSNYPQVYASYWRGRQYSEDDCACPTAPFTYSPEHYQPEAILATPEIIQFNLPQNYLGVYSPVTGGIAALNPTAQMVLRTFTFPCSSSDAVQRSGITSYQAQIAIEQFLYLGLLQTTESNSRFHCANSQTLVAWIHLTEACNLNCAYCYAPRSNRRMDWETGKAALQAIWRSAEASGFSSVYLKYAGGEPTLNFELLKNLHHQALQEAQGRNLQLHATMLSNGVALTPAMANDLKDLGIGLTLSLDGLWSEHDQQRPRVDGQGSAQAVQKALQVALDAGLQPHISITITAQNAGTLAPLVQFALAKGITFKFNFYRETPQADPRLSLLNDPQGVIDGVKAAFSAIEANLPPWSLMDGLIDLSYFSAPHHFTCGSGQSYLVVGVDGAVSPCHMEMSESVSDIWAADPLSEVRQRSQIQVLPVEQRGECKTCTWRYACAGGCPRLGGSGPSPYCAIYKAIYPEILRLEGLRLLKWGRNSIN